MDNRIVRAMRLMEKNISKPPDYASIAAAVGLSTHHFHRLFASELKETPGACLRRMRLDIAATRLRWTQDSVAQLASLVGYASQPSFTQAFVRRFGMAPIAFRHEREQWPVKQTQHVQHGRVALIERNSLQCIAKRYLGDPCSAPDHWVDFFAILPEEYLDVSRYLYIGLIYDDVRFTPPDRVRYDCCVVIENANAQIRHANKLGLHYLKTTAGLHARIQHSGHYTAKTDPLGCRSIAATYGFLLDEWMSASKYQLAGQYAMEVYTRPHGHCDPSDLKCDIHVLVS